MTRINIYITQTGLSVVGHGTNEPCTRISTIFQILIALLESKIDTLEETSGLSSVVFSPLTKSEQKIFDRIIALVLSLPDLYPRSFEITNNR